MTRYVRDFNTYKTYTCGICRSTKRLFVQCVPCVQRFIFAWGVDIVPLQELFHAEDIPGPLLGVEQSEDSHSL